MFPKFDRRLVLTDLHGAGVSNWRLPRWFYPDGNKPPLTYHPDRRRWRRHANHAYLRSVGRGQEFVPRPGPLPRGRQMAVRPREQLGLRHVKIMKTKGVPTDHPSDPQENHYNAWLAPDTPP